MTPQDVLKLVEQRGVEFVDLRFLGLAGPAQHLTVPARELSLDSFTRGFDFAGSSNPVERAAGKSEMAILPDPAAAFIDPFCQHTTLSMIGDIRDSLTGQRRSSDPRSIALKAVEHLRSTGIADAARFGPELEFFIFDQVCYDQGMNYARYRVDSREGTWRRGVDEPENLGNQMRPGQGCSPVPPADTMHNLRSEMVMVLEQCGIEVTTHHHESATGGQAGIDLRHDRLVEISDKVLLFKYIVKNVAARHGKVVTFMPKPLFEESGSGMTTHFSLWKQDDPLFGGDRYAGLSELGLWVIGGLIKHAGAVAAFTNPTTSSYRRLVPGFEGLMRVGHSVRSRSALIRIPGSPQDPRSGRIELRGPDSSCNPYLALSAILLAALDGIENRIDPGPAIDENPSGLSADEQAGAGRSPASLEAALHALEQDHGFLLKGDVFTESVIQRWIRYKMDEEVAALRARPHPYEFCLYFDI